MKLALLFLLVIVLPPPGKSQSAAEALADSLFQRQMWNEAAKHYEAITTMQPVNGRAWYRLGAAAFNMEDYERSISAYRSAGQGGIPLQFVQYTIASAFARWGKADSALDALASALDAGFSDVSLLSTDSDLESLRDEPQFARILQRADTLSHPCEYDVRYHGLDFWMGEWDVVNGRGQLAGTSRIERSLHGCVIVEHWTGTLGVSGMSMNYFDPADSVWRQNWADDRGGIVRYEGRATPGEMHFRGENVSMNGLIKRARTVLKSLGDGTVSHRIEHSTDDGKTWNVVFNARYIRKTDNRGE